MWDGIYIDGSSKGYLIISGSTLIEDALNAVVSNSGGGFDIHHAIFNRNLQAIVINNSNNTSTPGTIKHSIFTSRVLQHFSNPSNYANIDVLALTLNSLPSAHLIYPNDAPRSAFGIKTSNSKYIEIGDQYDQGFSNLFDNVACGIFIDKSNAFITNNTFQNISLPPIKSNCVNCPAQYSTAIKAVGDYSTGNFSIWLGDNGSNFHLNNHFTNIYRAIDIEGFKTIDIRGNEIHNSNTVNQPSNSGMGASGIYIKSPSANNHIKIWECIVNNCYDAIKVDRDYSISLKNSEIDISTNLIDATGSGQCRFGIKVADLTAQWIILTSTTNIDITNNTITNAYNCISADNIKTRLNIQSNSAAIRNNSSSSIQKRGIALTSCWNAVVSDNCNIIGLPSSIDYSSAAYSTEDIRGIYIYNSPGIQIIRNSIKNTSKALMLDGNCAPTGSNFTRVASNNFIKSYYGLYMNNSPNIGAQGNPNPSYNFATGTNTPDVSENKWLGTFNKKTYVANSTAFDQNIFSKFYVRDDGLGAISETFPINSGNGFAPFNNPYAQGTGFLSISGAIEDWAFSGPNQCGLTFPSPILVSEEPDNVAPSTEEKIENLELINETPDPITDIEQGINWEKQKFAYTVLDQNPEIIQESMVLNDFYYFNESQAIGDLNYVDKAIEQQSFLLAKNINNNVVTSKTIELNQKIMNDLILKREENPIFLFNQIDIENLTTIAAQCIYTGGNAVLQGRILLGCLNGNSISYADDCVLENNSRIINKSKNNVLHSNSFYLSPNPSNGFLKLKYQLNEFENASFYIYNMKGQIISNFELNSNQKELIINDLNINNGVYYYQVVVDGKLIKTEILVILN